MVTETLSMKDGNSIPGHAVHPGIGSEQSGSNDWKIVSDTDHEGRRIVWNIGGTTNRPVRTSMASEFGGSMHPALNDLPEQVIEQLDRIKVLTPGWDSYGADPIEERAINIASEIVRLGLSIGLPIPGIAPGSDGTVGVTWETAKGEIYIDVSSSSLATYALDLFTEGEDSTEESDGVFYHDIYLLWILGLIVD